MSENVISLFSSIMAGLGTTLALFAIALVVSIPLGFLITLMLRSKLKVVKWIAEVYVYILRGTPLLLFFVYFGLPYIPGIGKFSGLCTGSVPGDYCQLFRSGVYTAGTCRGASVFRRGHLQPDSDPESL